MCPNPDRVILALAFALSLTTVSLGQSQETTVTTVGPFPDEPRFFAAFSAKAITRVVQRPPDRRRLERTVVATYYRDSFGRVRVEYTPGSDSAGNTMLAIVLPNPYARQDRVFLVDDAAKLIESMDFKIVATLFNATRAFTIPTGLRRFTNFYTAEYRFSRAGLFEDLGSRMIDGIEANGVRFTASGSSALAVDERWESPDLGLVVRASLIDQESGWEIDYTLTDIRRTEPKQQLFVMPAGYQYRQDGSLRLESPDAELLRIMAK